MNRQVICRWTRLLHTVAGMLKAQEQVQQGIPTWRVCDFSFCFVMKFWPVISSFQPVKLVGPGLLACTGYCCYRVGTCMLVEADQHEMN